MNPDPITARNVLKKITQFACICICRCPENSGEGGKRARSEDNEILDNNSTTTGKNCQQNNNPPSSRGNAGGGRHLDLNFPLPNPRGKAAIVKLYDLPNSGGDLKLTDMVELVGVVGLDPALAHLGGGGEEEEGMVPHLPPPSLVPRLHVVTYSKLAHNNPLGRRESQD